MNVRLATIEDKEQVLKLLDEFSALLKAKDIPSQVGGAMFEEIIGRNDTMIFVAEEEGELLGMATFYLLPNLRHGWYRGHVEDFFVTDSARNQGVGTKLFTAMKDYCRKHNVKVIKLDSGNDLANAHRFYERHGGRSTEKFFRFDLD